MYNGPQMDTLTIPAKGLTFPLVIYVVKRADPGHCCAYISGDFGRGHQCSRKHKGEYRDGKRVYRFCKQHHPDTQYAKRKKCKDEQDARDREYERIDRYRHYRNKLVEKVLAMDEDQVPEELRNLVRKVRSLLPT